LGALGGAAAAALGDRLGRYTPHWATALVLIVFSFALASPGPRGQFAATVGAIQFGWSFIIPYQLSLITRADVTKRLSAFLSVAVSLGAAVGPALGAAVKESNGFANIAALVTVTTLAATMAFVHIRHRLDAVAS